MIELKPILAGAGGAALAAMTGPDRSRAQRFVEFLAGFLISMLFTEAVLEFFRLAAATYSGPIGFSLGYFGMTLAAGLLGALRTVDWAGIVRDRLGGGR